MTDAMPSDKFSGLCRLCASQDTLRMEIFSDSGLERNLSHKIVTCLPFEVSQDDCLPKSLCYKCIYNLENFYEFRRNCIKAISLLEDFLRQSGKKIGSCARTDPPTLKIESFNSGPSDNNALPDWSDTGKNGADFNNADFLNPSDFLEACLCDSSSPKSASQGDGTKQSYTEDNLLDISAPPEVYKCKVCTRAFASHASLLLHSKFHGDGKKRLDGLQEMYPCYVCDKVFGSKGHLALHSRIHMGENHTPQNNKQAKLYRCELCTKSYSMAKHLWGHVSTAHRGHPLVTCETCLRTFSSIANLTDHIRLKHSGSALKHKQSNGKQVNLIKQEEKEGSGGGGSEVENTDEDTSNRTLSEDKRSIDEAAGSRRKSTKPRKIERDVDSENAAHKKADGEVKEETENIPAEADIFDEDQLGETEFTSSVNPEMMECEFAENLMESETVFCCEICIREFNDRGSLWLHMLYSHREEASKACGLCLKIFSDNDTLIQHVETCNPRGAERRRYSCTVCARQHDSRKKLVTHAKIHGLVDDQGNPIDPESFVILNSTGYTNTIGFNHSVIDEGAAFQCGICYKPFETEAKMAKHKASAHRENKAPNPYYFVCDICGLASSTRLDKWRHMSTEHAGDPTITCPQPQCNKVFSSEQLKKEHCESHHDTQGVYPSTCEICGKLWNTRVEYWKHMMGVHPDCLPLVCGVCLKVFCNLSALVTHVRDNHYPLSGGEHCCDICGRPYSKLSKMSRHRKIHSTVEVPEELRTLVEPLVTERRGRERGSEGSHFMDVSGPPYTCEQCPEVESAVVCDSLDDLIAHRRDVHNSVTCDLCTKYYASTSHLWKHVSRTHKGHPDVTCHVCKRTSANRVILAAHMSKHKTQLARENSEEPDGPDLDNTQHICSKCNKVFRKGSLMRKHFKHCKGPRAAPAASSLPPPVDGIYTCAKCGKQFMSQNYLYKHMKSVHIIYSCEVCDSKHDSKTLLFHHIKEVHSEDPTLKCDVEGCDKILRCKTDMMRHRRTHTQSLAMYVCKFCAELLPSKMKMRKHLKSLHPSESKHLCFLCMADAPNFKKLEEHVAETHAALLRRPNICKVCCRTCSSKSKLLDHIKNHSPTFHPCRICIKIFNSKETLQDHINNHPKEGEEEEDEEEEDDIEEVELDESSIMDIIGAGKGSVGSLQEDSIREDSVDSPGVDTTTTDSSGDKRKPDDASSTASASKKIRVEFSCVACDETFDSRSGLLVHQEDEHDDVTCKKCGIVSSDVKDHDDHRSKCEEEEGREASNILENMMTRDSVGSPSSPEDFENTNGDVLTSERLGRNKNARKVYMDDLSPSACQICGKVWPAKKHLWQHLIRFHKAEACSTCGVCLACFPDYKSLSVHLVSEHPNNYDGDGTNLTCRVCGKYHNARAKLNSHVSIHSGQEERALAGTHMCLICNRTFPLFNQLSEHLFNIHKTEVEQLKKVKVQKVAATPGRRRRNNKTKLSVDSSKLLFYQCDICSLVFASEIGLTNHKWSHKNSDNFKCGQCGEVFPTVAGLKEHKSSKHPGAEFICAECKCAFSTYNDLADHNKSCSTKQTKTLEQEIEEVESEDEETTELPNKSDDKSDSSSSDSSDSSDTSDESSSDDSGEESGTEETPAQYTKCNLSESSTSDEEEPAGLTLTEGDIVQIVEVQPNTPASTD